MSDARNQSLTNGQSRGLIRVMEATRTYRIPPTFHADHVARDLPGGRVVKTLAKHVVVELDATSYDELLSDADHYASGAESGFGAEFGGLVMSAKATAAALRKVGRPDGERSLEQMTPPELDTEWFPIMADIWTATSRVIEIRKTIARTVWGKLYVEKYERWLSGRERKAYPVRTERYAKSDGTGFYPSDLDKELERLEAAEARVAQLKATEAPFRAEWSRRGGWERYTLVGGGKIHTRHEACGTLRPTTQRLILVEASGMDADTVVARYTYTACSICFKEAPVG